MKLNKINRDLFRTTNLSEEELFRRLQILCECIHGMFNEIISKFNSIDTSINTVSVPTAGYTGTIYAVDANNKTVELKVIAGTLKTATIV